MPSNYERGAPSDEVRVFDGGEDEEDVEGSRLPLLIVIALLVLAAFGGVVWLAYQRGVQQGHSEVPRVIAAQPGPARVAPTNAGGTPTPYTGLKIYQQPAPSNEEGDVDTTPPATPPAAAPATAMAPAMAPAMTPAKPTQAAAPPAMTPTKPVAMTPAPTPPAAKPVVATPPAAKPAPIRTAEAEPAHPAPVAAPAQPTPVPPAAAPAAGGLLQIGAYKSEAEANAAWTAYMAKHRSLLTGTSPDVKQVDLGAKGTWYRLRIVTGGKSAAASLCEKLKAEGGACFPAK